MRLRRSIDDTRNTEKRLIFHKVRGVQAWGDSLFLKLTTVFKIPIIDHNEVSIGVQAQVLAIRPVAVENFIRNNPMPPEQCSHAGKLPSVFPCISALERILFHDEPAAAVLLLLNATEMLPHLGRGIPVYRRFSLVVSDPVDGFGHLQNITVA
jgi:hypothetical protein